jgi:rhodanese-related sulfurtransferase
MILKISGRLVLAALATLAIIPAARAQQATVAAPPAGAPAATAPAADQRITLDAVRERLDSGKKIVFVDSRGNVAGAPMVKGAAHVPLKDAEAWAANVPKDTFIVAYCACASEGSSLNLTGKLRAMGFTDAYALKGGIQGWKAAGLPVETGAVSQ